MVRRLTFELSGRQRQDARARLAKMYSVPPTGPWWPAVGAPLERGVRPQFAFSLSTTSGPLVVLASPSHSVPERLSQAVKDMSHFVFASNVSPMAVSLPLICSFRIVHFGSAVHQVSFAVKVFSAAGATSDSEKVCVLFPAGKVQRPEISFGRLASWATEAAVDKISTNAITDDFE